MEKQPLAHHNTHPVPRTAAWALCTSGASTAVAKNTLDLAVWGQPWSLNYSMLGLPDAAHAVPVLGSNST
jgi:hypothetical protein